MKGSEPISNTENIIDSRDIIDRINYLEGTEDEEEQAELQALQALEEEAQASPDWQYGETLIQESYWEDYVRELIEDTGDIPKDLPPYIEAHIDWEGIAEDVAMDYMMVNFDGEGYYIRA